MMFTQSFRSESYHGLDLSVFLGCVSQSPKHENIAAAENAVKTTFCLLYPSAKATRTASS